MTWGGFNWKMNFKWNTAPAREDLRRNNDRSEPLYTPTIAGGLFAVDRNFFYEVSVMLFRIPLCYDSIILIN